MNYIYKKRFPHKKKNHQGSKGRSGTHLFQVSDFPHLNAKYSVSFFVFSIGFDLCASCMECKKLYLVCIWALKLFIIFSLTIFSWCLKPYGVLGTMCLPQSHLFRNLVSSNSSHFDWNLDIKFLPFFMYFCQSSYHVICIDTTH